MLYQFIAAYPPDMLQQRFAAMTRDYPWLVRLFPVLGDPETAPELPKDVTLLPRVLQGMLTEMAHPIPHIAIVHSLHIADDDSLAVLSTLQTMAGHGLSIVAGVDPAEDGHSVPKAVASFVTPVTTVLPLMPLTKEQLRAYLQELLPEINPGEINDPR